MAENYQVKQGDCIYSIAYDRGFFGDTIWDHPNNKDLKDKRTNPNVLLPGDNVYIPDKRLREYSETTNQVYKYKCKNTPKELRIQLKFLETPLKDVEYTLDIDGKEQKGKTDGEGWLKQKIVPNAKTAKLKLADGIEFDLRLGHLDPSGELAGVQERLQTLGLYEGPISGKHDDETKASLKVFQLTHDLEATGEADENTKRSLIEMTGA